MTNDPKKKLDAAAHDIDVGLNGLFGALGEAIGDMVSRLEDGSAGAVTRDHVFETDKGPIRAHAGVRLRMGGLDIDTKGDAAPKPVNPNRKRHPAEAAQQPAAKTLEYDLFEDAEAWIFTADVPGVGRDDLVLKTDDTHLHLTTTGQRFFKACVDLGQAYDFDGIETRLHNGVLTLNIPKSVPR